MKTEITEDLKEIKKYKNIDDTTLIAEALQLGIKELLRKTIIDQYIEGKISQKKAEELVGFDIINKVDEQKEAIIEDVKWGLKKE